MPVTPADLSDVKRWASLYLQAGLHPIEIVGPNVQKSAKVKSPGKQPGHGGWQSETLPLHPDTYRDGCNLGLRMGRQANGKTLVCVDVDDESPHWLYTIAPAELWPLTLIQRTGKNRWHFLFVWPDEVPVPSNSVKLHDPATGQKIPVDLRADGGQIIVAPSIHPETGGPYTWINAGQETATLPIKIAEALIRAANTPRTHAVSHGATVVPRVSPPQILVGADTVPPVADSMGSGGVSYCEISDTQWRRVCRKLAARTSPTAACFERLAKGLPLAEPGERDSKITAMCWALAREVPEADPAQIANLFEQSLSLMHSLSPFAAPCDVATKFRSAVLKQQNEIPEVALQTTATGNPKANAENALRVLRGDALLYGRFVYDEFAERVIVARAVPWDKPGTAYPRQVTNEDFTFLGAYCSKVHRLDLRSTTVFEAVCAIARENGYHPVREYLISVAAKWDGIPRLDTWLIDYCGAEDTQVTRWSGAWWLISAVERVADPGCKSDYCLILEGAQGKKKSTALRALAGAEWFTDDIPDINQAVATAQALSGKWLVELSELAGVRSAKDVDRTKSFLTRQVDRYRVPYGKVTQDFPRQCVFAGSTNDTEYLTDPTGARRFWPVRVNDQDVDVAGIREMRDQLWAEAAIRLARGERHWPETAEEKAAFDKVSAKRQVPDSWADKILAWCDNPIGYRGQVITTAFLLEQIFDIRAARHGDDQRVAKCLQVLGWVRCEGPNRSRFWRPPFELKPQQSNVFPLPVRGVA